MSEDKNVKFIGKIVKMPKNVKAKNALCFLENIKVDKKKLWYILIEKDENELQCIKYNNKMGVDLKIFIDQLTTYYSKDATISEHINNLMVEGNDKFSVIKNIPDIEIKGKKMITFLTDNLIQLLYK